MMWRRQAILETEILKLAKPRILWRFFSTENIQSNIVEKVAREPCEHSKNSELPDVEESLARQAASQEADNRSRGTWKKSLEIADGLLVVLADECLLRLGQDQWAKA